MRFIPIVLDQFAMARIKCTGSQSSEYGWVAEARSDIFDYIDRFYNPRMRRKLQKTENSEIELNSSVRNIRA